MLAVRRQVSIVSGDGCVLFEHFGRGRKKAGKKRDDVVEGTVVAAEGQVRLCNRVQCQSLQVLLCPATCTHRAAVPAGCWLWYLVQVGSSSAAHQEYMRTLRHCVNAAAVMAELSDPSAERALEEGWVPRP